MSAASAIEGIKETEISPSRVAIWDADERKRPGGRGENRILNVDSVFEVRIGEVRGDQSLFIHEVSPTSIAASEDLVFRRKGFGKAV